MPNVALYGGSFDPPHLGHVMVVSHLLLNDDSIHRVVVMPCYEHLEKSGLSPFELRYRMCQSAFGWLPRTEVSTLERDLGGGSLTVRTVQTLKAQNPTWRVFVVMGSDLIQRAPQWEGWDELLQEATPLVVGRAGIASVHGNTFGGTLDFNDERDAAKALRRVATPISPAVSSTEIRALLARGEYDKADRYLPHEVLKTIASHGLYRSAP